MSDANKTRSLVAFLVVLVVVTAVVLMFGRGSSSGAPTQAAGSGIEVADELMAGLCVVVGDLSAGDTESAARVFFDGAHDDLHDLAGQLEQTDRALMTRILVEKGKVEAGFTDIAFGNTEAIRAATVESVLSLAELISPPGEFHCIVHR